MNTTFPSRAAVRLFGAATLAALLTACGGGGSAAPTASVAGTAATGAAIAAGTVTLQCVSGTSTSATTGTDGSFTIDVSSVTLPCVGRVDYKDSTGTAQKLHTFITSAGTANITPVTELLVANLTGGTAADAFDKFDASKAKAFTAAQIKAAADAVKAYLKNTLGVDTSNLPDDPVGTKLMAKTGGAAGDRFDAVLDDLAAKLKSSGKKLADAVNDLGKGGSSGSGGGASGGTTAGCSGATAAFFTSTAGTYSVAASTYDTTPSGHPAVLGFANGASYTVVVNTNCTINVGSITLAYVANTFSSDATIGQYDADMNNPVVAFGHYEQFGGKRLLGFSDPVTKNGAQFSF